ncbi:MAG: tRNA guanosine(34) transglycosylase Tgt [Patescibacteria group bacterium]|jgi:queuine tRNA-ribosyltransferase
MSNNFLLQKKSRKSSARAGKLRTIHGIIDTPFFMPIATRGAVKTLSSDEIVFLGAQIILSNTYHLWQRPGLPVVKKAGGLHKFMNWKKPILTDSGGYQVFSLARSRKITEQGVNFVSEIDGRRHLLTPERAIEIQRILGSDIIMCLDECAPYPSAKEYIKKSVELTTRWAARCQKYFKKKKMRGQQIFGIVQGSIYRQSRLKSAADLLKINFDGYAVGGLAVGEPAKKMYEVLDYTVPALLENKPRYLMGAGKPEQIVQAVKRGIDMFDCVIPTRNARHGLLYKFKPSVDLNRNKFYEEIRIKQSKYAGDFRPLDEHCQCPACRGYSRAYLRHLFMINETLAWRLATLHNVSFYLDLMKKIRQKILRGQF